MKPKPQILICSCIRSQIVSIATDTDRVHNNQGTSITLMWAKELNKTVFKEDFRLSHLTNQRDTPAKIK